jgi:hypothetical protein
MSPIQQPTMVERMRSLLTLPRRSLRALFPSGLPRWLWAAFQTVALALAVVGSYYAWREFPADVQVEPAFFAVAVGIYVISFGMHILAWHALSGIFFSGMRLRENAEAVAGSNLVKYLPTIAWYIANRTHYYHQRGVAQQRVVVASLSELALMVGSGASILLGLWTGQVVSPLVGVLVCVAGVLVLVWALARYADNGGARRRWAAALLWYGCSWLMGMLILAALMRALQPIELSNLYNLMMIWMLAGLASYAASLTLGAVGILREITLTVLIAQHWPLAAGIAAAICVKLVLTLGEIACSLLILGWLRLWRRLAERPGSSG